MDFVYSAKHRFADVSAQKIRPFAQLVRGKNVDEALEQLKFLHNRGARQLEAVIKSAVGNAEDRGCRDLDELVITECKVDGGPMFKRIRPRARGTAFSILRRLSHIVVQVSDMAAIQAAAEAATGTPAAVVTPPSTHVTPPAIPSAGEIAPVIPVTGAPVLPTGETPPGS